MNYKRKRSLHLFHRVSRKVYCLILFIYPFRINMHPYAFIFLHIVNYNHRNLSTLRRFIHDVLLLECPGSLLCLPCLSILYAYFDY